MKPPIGLSPRLWVVIRPTGERHYIDREPTDETVAQWAQGLDVTIAEYRFVEVIYDPPPASERK